MKKVAKLTLAAVLLLGGVSTAGPALAAVGLTTPTDTGNCHYNTIVTKPAYDEVVKHPAIDAVYETVVITPEVSTVLYRYVHTENGNGKGPADKWMEGTGWNGVVNGVDHGKGWVLAQPLESRTEVTAAVTKQEPVTKAVPASEETIHHAAETTQELECVDVLPKPDLVTPLAPTFNAPTCDVVYGSVTVPTQPEGVEVHHKPLSNTGPDGHPYWSVSFYPREGFVFPADIQTTYSFRVDSPVCEGKPSEDTTLPKNPDVAVVPPVDTTPTPTSTDVVAAAAQTTEAPVVVATDTVMAPTQQLAYTGKNDMLDVWAALGLLALLAGTASVTVARRKA